jgi:hypothetical protein
MPPLVSLRHTPIYCAATILHRRRRQQQNLACQQVIELTDPPCAVILSRRLRNTDLTMFVHDFQKSGLTKLCITKYMVITVMNIERAEHTLETIRTLMERSQRYQHISGYSGLIAGALVLAGCATLAWVPMPLPARTAFAIVWSAVFIAALCCHLALTFARARQRGEPVWSRQARTVSLAVLPSFVASLAVSVSFWQMDRTDMLPGIWLLLYACGALATSFFAPRSIRFLGCACLVLGVIGVTLFPHRPLLTMAIGFGATHVFHGICVVVAELREERFNRQLQELLTWQETPGR